MSSRLSKWSICDLIEYELILITISLKQIYMLQIIDRHNNARAMLRFRKIGSFILDRDETRDMKLQNENLESQQRKEMILWSLIPVSPRKLNTLYSLGISGVCWQTSGGTIG